jgi:Skp family chaperone for outer membrane proteins
MGVDLCVWRVRIGRYLRRYASGKFKRRVCVSHALKNADSGGNLLILTSAVIIMLLVISGVEQNPGPSQITMDGIKAALEELKADLRQDLASFRNDLQGEMTNIRDSLDSHKASCDQQNNELQEQLRSLQEENIQLKQALQRKEERGRKNNVIIKGIPEEDNENTEGIVRNICEAYNVNIGLDAIADTFRIGRQKGKRPILCMFNSHRCKTDLMRGHRASGHSSFAIYNDLTKQQQTDRRVLAAYRDIAIEKGHDASIQAQKVKIDGKLHTVNQLRSLFGDLPPGTPPRRRKENNTHTQYDIMDHTRSSNAIYHSGANGETSAAEGSVPAPPTRTVTNDRPQSGQMHAPTPSTSASSQSDVDLSAMDTEPLPHLYSTVTRRGKKRLEDIGGTDNSLINNIRGNFAKNVADNNRVLDNKRMKLPLVK